MPVPSDNSPRPRGQPLGRYVLHDEIAAGGMASVHIARMIGPAGFARTVAIKKLHAQYAKDPEFVAMFLDEARLAARVQHPNVVPMLDVVAREGELFLVMDYVRGESLARLLAHAPATEAGRPVRILAALLGDALSGLHAAHEAKNEQGADLAIVHRDVSPQNILVGLDGVARVLDFGIAKAAVRLHSTRDGQIKGKLRYMSPEQISQRPVDRRTDVYAAAVVAWETFSGRKLFPVDDAGAIIKAILDHAVPPLSEVAPWVPAALGEVVHRGLAVEPDARFATALEMAEAIEATVALATAREVGAWVGRIARATLEKRAAVVALVERSDPDEASASPLGLPLPQEKAPPGAEDATSKVASDPRVGETSVTGSSLSGDVARAVATPAPRGASVRVLATVAVVAIALGIGWYAIGAGATRRNADDASLAAPPTAPEATAVAPSSVAARPSPAPIVAASAAHSSATAASDAPPAAPSTNAAATGVPHAARARSTGPAKPSPRKPSSAKPGCDPPYTIDADGTKVFKTGCL